MKIEFHTPQLIHETGQRFHNEDSIFPSEDLEDQSNVFIVCDGVGGEEKGEEASRIISSFMGHGLNNVIDIEEEEIRKALSDAEEIMDEFIYDHPGAQGMATTLTVLAKNNQGVLVGHVGDSRVYQFRSGEILFKTIDHSLVQELLLNNVLTEEQAASHPRRNVITRAIFGRARPASIDFSKIEDIRVNDYFLLCSDGINEGISDSELCSILNDDSSNDVEKRQAIVQQCMDNSQDNFSAILLRVKNVEQEQTESDLD